MDSAAELDAVGAHSDAVAKDGTAAELDAVGADSDAVAEDGKVSLDIPTTHDFEVAFPAERAALGISFLSNDACGSTHKELGIRVSKVKAGGVAALGGQIQEHDWVVAVNGADVRAYDKLAVVAAIQAATGAALVLGFRRELHAPVLAARALRRETTWRKNNNVVELHAYGDTPYYTDGVNLYDVDGDDGNSPTLVGTIASREGQDGGSFEDIALRVRFEDRDRARNSDALLEEVSLEENGGGTPANNGERATEDARGEAEEGSPAGQRQRQQETDIAWTKGDSEMLCQVVKFEIGLPSDVNEQRPGIAMWNIIATKNVGRHRPSGLACLNHYAALLEAGKVDHTNGEYDLGGVGYDHGRKAKMGCSPSKCALQ